MSEKNTELAGFLRRARSQVDASRAGLPADGRVRRVHGLRRAEVAFLAGVSTDYYGSKRLRHPVIGDLTVEYETLTLPGDAATTLYVYSTEAGSPSSRTLNVLASWSLTGTAYASTSG